jgi:hypothetical protein
MTAEVEGICVGLLMQSRVEFVTLSSTYRASEPSARRQNIDPILPRTLSSSLELGLSQVRVESLPEDLEPRLLRAELAMGESPYIGSVDLLTYLAQRSKVRYLLHSYAIVLVPRPRRHCTYPSAALFAPFANLEHGGKPLAFKPAP